jgi:hypothetical protein
MPDWGESLLREPLRNLAEEGILSASLLFIYVVVHMRVYVYAFLSLILLCCYKYNIIGEKATCALAAVSPIYPTLDLVVNSSLAIR